MFKFNRLLLAVFTLLLVLTACSQPPEELELAPSSDSAIKILDARARSETEVALVFDQNMTTSAEDISNYSLTPALAIESAAVNVRDPRIVVLKTAAQSDSEYTITVKNVKTVDGVPVGPTGTSATFLGAGVDDGDYTPIIPETTNVVTPDLHKDILRGSTTALLVSKNSPLLDGVEVGDIIVSGPVEGNESLKYGFLSKVSGFTEVAGGTFVKLEDGSLEEAVQQGEVSEEFTLTSDDIDSSTFTDGVSFSESIGTQGGIKLLNYDIDKKVICDGDGDKKTTDDQLVLDGGLKANLDPFLKLKIKWFSLRKFEAGVKLDESFKLEVSGGCSKEIKEKVKLASHNFKPITFFIGPVPVVITPYVAVYYGLDGKVSIEANYKVEQSFDAKYGKRWERKKGWSDIKEEDWKFEDSKPSFEGNAEIRAYMTAEAGVKFYGGNSRVYVYAEPFAEAKASFKIPSPTFEFCYNYGLDVGAGANLVILKKTLAEEKVKLFSVGPGEKCKFLKTTEALLTYTVNGKGSISVAGQPICGANKTCQITVAKGSKVTLSRGSGDFGSWSGNACDGSTASTCQVTVDSNVNISANYKAKITARIQVIEGDVEIYLKRAGTTSDTLIKRYNTDGQTNTLDLTNYLSGGDDVIRIRSVVQKYGAWPFKASRRSAGFTILADGEPRGEVKDRCTTCSSKDLGSFRINKTTGRIQKL